MAYKFKIGNTIPPDDKIDKHKNFKKLKANYDQQVKPLYKRQLFKDPKALIVVRIILLLTYIIVEISQKEEHEGPETHDSEISAPSAGPEGGAVNKPTNDTIKYPTKSNTADDSVRNK